MEDVKIVRVRNPGIVKLIEPHLTFHDPAYKPLFLQTLTHWMINAPDSVFVIAGFDGDDLVAFTIAQNPSPSHSFVEIAQVWSRSNNPRTIADEMFARVVVWGIGLGKVSLRAETRRDEAIYRRFGFTPQATIVGYDLGRSADELHKIIRMITNGQPVQTEHRQPLDTKSVAATDSDSVGRIV